MRNPFIAGNWKMHKTVQEAVVYTKEFRRLVENVTEVEIAIAPAFTALHAVAEAARNSNVGVAAQDLYWEAEGAFTGEVSAGMIRETGAEYVIIGHSERRALFGETDEGVNRKTRAALAVGLTPIVCIGETLEQREADRTFAVLDRQIRDGLKGLTPDELAAMVVAYEPVWAIGTGRTATPAQAGEAHTHIRQRLIDGFGEDPAGQCHIIYGGSVKPGNIRALMEAGHVDGALVGGASLDVATFAEIVAGSLRASV